MKKSVLRFLLGGWTAALIVGASSSGCDSKSAVGGASADDAGGPAGSISVKLDASKNDLTGSSSGITPTGDANCGIQTRTAAHGIADVLLVFDRSASMEDSTTSDSACNNGGSGRRRDAGAGSGCTTRWSALTTGVSATLVSTNGAVNWGLKLFSTPSGGACTVSSGVEVPIGPSSVPAIQAAIADVSPDNNTPTAQAVQAATTYLKTVSDNNPKYILLATDGEPNCASGFDGSGSNVKGTVTAITAAKTAGFLTYVIGIGPSVGNLDNFAAAGGTAKYFPASSPDELAAAFGTIGKAVTSCTFTLDSPPPSPDNIAVYLDTNLVGKDAANGWSYGASSTVIVFNGSACAAVTSGSAKSVRVLFGCPGEVPPPTLLF